MSDPCFTLFDNVIDPAIIPAKLNDAFGIFTPHICKIAADELQIFLMANDANWIHNFGISDKKPGVIKGKMFGILIVKNAENKLGYLSGFSGKMADGDHHERFVPSVFDISTENYFINTGMRQLTQIGNQISFLESTSGVTQNAEIESLKEERKIKSADLQKKLFDNYHFLNWKKESKNLWLIFENQKNKVPPSAAGECAAPKLFQYAFKNNMVPIAIAEFWWGPSSATNNRKHGEFYPACEERCRPILNYMLSIGSNENELNLL